MKARRCPACNGVAPSAPAARCHSCRTPLDAAPALAAQLRDFAGLECAAALVDHGHRADAALVRRAVEAQVPAKFAASRRLLVAMTRLWSGGNDASLLRLLTIWGAGGSEAAAGATLSWWGRQGDGSAASEAAS